ncbi:MAG TPA: hypothetical protein VHC69_09515 [Polyangiaceae bacterium]|nr:hypothetical protein [Polyangiaceae bacterium]
MMPARTRAALFGLAAYACVACTTKYRGETEIVAGPTQTNFIYLSEVLDYSCGNLACHGAVGRNLRLYGTYGRRLDPKDVACDQTTTAAEIQANYASAAGLEPELTAEVVAALSHADIDASLDAGIIESEVERLTLVRKARGTESHKGGTVFNEGSFGDRCLVSWFTGTIDYLSCSNLFAHAPKVTCTPAWQ